MTREVRVGICPVLIEYSPREILDRIPLYEDAGFDLLWEGDHTLPWHHTNGHSGSALVMAEAYLQLTKKIEVHYMVSGTGIRHHPIDIALNVTTMALLHGDRVALHLGTGEAMNDKTTTGYWPSSKERLERLKEAIKLIRMCWQSNDYFTFKGAFFNSFFYLYDKPSKPIPIIGVAGGPRAAEVAGRLCDGILTLGPVEYLKNTILPAFEKGARYEGKDPGKLSKMVFLDTSYHPDINQALRKARLYGGVLIPECYSVVQDPRIIEQRSFLVRDDILMDVFTVASKPEDIVEKYAMYVKAGFDTLIWAEISPDPNLTPRVCRDVVIPALKSSV
ncbi:MAG: LLM class flavin-dependent oxidoreductase [Candidatus Caldarchaeum sp.]